MLMERIQETTLQETQIHTRFEKNINPSRAIYSIVSCLQGLFKVSATKRLSNLKRSFPPLIDTI